MKVEVKKIDSVKDELVELNNKFHEKYLLFDAFYEQLIQAGFGYNRCILVSIFPDGRNTYCGQIIRQDGQIVKFDIDLDSAEYSSWEFITNDFRKKFEKIAEPNL